MDRGMKKVVIVTRKTRLEELIYKYNTLEQAKFYIEHMGVDFSDYIVENDNYQTAVRKVCTIAEKYARVQRIDRTFLPNMIFGAEDVIISVGQDGLVANVMKYVNGQTLIGVNPDTKRWDGVLLPFEAGDLEVVLKQVLEGNYHTKKVTMAEAKTKDGQSMLAVNDFFVGQKTHTSARYDIIFQGKSENQSSSGIIVSTGLGATGWYRSVETQLQAAAEMFGGSFHKNEPLAWDADILKFVVREPYPSKSTQAGIVFGKILKNDNFKIISKMPENGVIFSDGMEGDAIEFNAGCEVTIGIAQTKGALVV